MSPAGSDHLRPLSLVLASLVLGTHDTITPKAARSSAFYRHCNSDARYCVTIDHRHCANKQDADVSAAECDQDEVCIGWNRNEGRLKVGGGGPKLMGPRRRCDARARRDRDSDAQEVIRFSGKESKQTRMA